jgi:hypothetical protein
MIKQLENAKTFKEIFDLYVQELEKTGEKVTYNKFIVKNSLDNLANFLDNSPLSVSIWGKLDREKS